MKKGESQFRIESCQSYCATFNAERHNENFTHLLAVAVLCLRFSHFFIIVENIQVATMEDETSFRFPLLLLGAHPLTPIPSDTQHCFMQIVADGERKNFWCVVKRDIIAAASRTKKVFFLARIKLIPVRVAKRSFLVFHFDKTKQKRDSKRHHHLDCATTSCRGI